MAKTKKKSMAPSESKAAAVDTKADTATTTTEKDAKSSLTTKPALETPAKKPQAPSIVDPVIYLVDELLPPEPSMADLSTARVLIVGATLLTFGTIGFYYIPGMINEEVDSPGSHLINAFYCAAITLTTYV